MQNQNHTPEPEQTIDLESRPISAEVSEQVSFDRYEVIGLLLLMYGWWKILSHAWIFALVCLAVGWLLAFATGSKRDGFIRIVGGISADMLKVLRALVSKVSNYLAEKRKGSAGNDND